MIAEHITDALAAGHDDHMGGIDQAADAEDLRVTPTMTFASPSASGEVAPSSLPAVVPMAEYDRIVLVGTLDVLRDAIDRADAMPGRTAADIARKCGAFEAAATLAHRTLTQAMEALQ